MQKVEIKVLSSIVSGQIITKIRILYNLRNSFYKLKFSKIHVKYHRKNEAQKNNQVVRD